MITMDMLGKVGCMRMRDSISNSAIAKRTGLARNTIKKWLKAPGSVAPKYLRAKDLRKIFSFEPVLLQALKADQLLHKDSRRTARALFAQQTRDRASANTGFEHNVEMCAFQKSKTWPIGEI